MLWIWNYLFATVYNVKTEEDFNTLALTYLSIYDWIFTHQIYTDVIRNGTLID